jgi:tRNA threonylcarbamoyladenosine biosynthesis protein TsaE
MRTHYLDSEAATLRFGQEIAHYSQELSVIFLQGELGAGKTTLVRGILKGLNYDGFVRSPSYTLVEPYLHTHKKPVYHFDLYRIHDPEELEYIGLRDYLKPSNLCIFEWPNHGAGELPDPDLIIHLDWEKEGRVAQLDAKTEYGKFVLDQLEKNQ